MEPKPGPGQEIKVKRSFRQNQRGILFSSSGDIPIIEMKFEGIHSEFSA